MQSRDKPELDMYGIELGYILPSGSPYVYCLFYSKGDS